ncbi:sensor histidine kinase [Flavobacterium foetidum]|uniref:sensor histidine kinase n=1 Tax=Flavobacterium foetidum TaxID=2026681 RepID=UPI0010755356|nr:ATP-binding protein [Flavobacterium foetidum]KAF2516995.1 histidine kinase [Flavobacterium foetidum]
MFVRALLFYILLIVLNINTIPAQQNSSRNTTTVPQHKNNTVDHQKLEQLRNKKVVSLSVILVIIIILLFYFFYQNNKLKQKIKRKDTKQKILLDVINSGIDSQEIERKKIASFLHDNVNSLLSSAGLHLNVFTTQNQIESEEIKKAKSILREAHDLLRDMSHDLVPSLLLRFGLIYALEDLCEKNSNSTIEFEFLSEVSTEKRYPEKFEMKIYFIVSELFNNIIKHSCAANAKIRLKEKNNYLIIKIQDNGIGFKNRKLKDAEGFGLNRIRARVKKYKGNLSVISKMNEGTKIKIEIPLPH